MAMAEEDIAPSSSPVSSDHKRKLDDLEEEAPNRETSRPPSTQVSEANGKPDGVLEAVEVEEDEEDEERRSDVPEVKRLRLEEQSADGAAEPTPQDQRTEAPLEEGGEPASTGIAQEAEEGLVSTTGNVHPDGSDELSPAAAGNLYPPDGSVPSTEQPQDLTQPTSRKIEVPNNKVGVLIGKAGDTIRLLQYNSGAKIQITRDADSDPYAATRPVELIGSLESITKAEHLIKDVIAEADAGGSPSLVARGFGAAQSGSEQVQIQVPNEKVGLIIGKGGETIKNLQTRSGARIQLIPQHLPDGDQSKERTVRVTGNKKQIETAREMIKEVMTQTPMKPSPLSSGYPQQSFRPRGPPGLPQWGLPRGPPPSAQPTNYDYQQRGMYPPQVGQYPPPAYGGYPQQPAPRTGFSPGWEQRPPTQTQGPPQSGAYDYYGQGGPPPSSAPAPGPTQAHSNYNYGQTQGSDYGQPHGYSQSVPPQQTYDNHAPIQHPYGASQQGYSQSAGAPSGYSQPYGRPPYGMPPTQGPPSHSYGPPRAAQPGDMQQYQGQPMSTAPSYASSGQPSQQSYPYGTNAPAQQPYPYGSTTGANDGYTQPVSVPAPGYGQQGGPSPYAQPTVGASQTGGYAQGGQVGGYAQYPSSQQGYGEQQTPSNPNYGGYQGSTDAGYASGAGSAYGAPPSGQQGYVQPPLNPPTYDQSIPQTGYGAHAGAAPVGYAKSLSPQPGYAQYAATAGTTATAGTAPDGQLYAQGHH